MKPLVLNAAAGVRNDVPLERFAKGDLATGSNIDIDETGAISRRLGTQVVVAGAAHSLWSNDEVACFVQGTTLKQLFPDMTTRTLQTGVTGARLSYAEVNGTVYWSDEIQSGAFIDGVAHQWGIQPPLPAGLTATFGELPAGTYGLTTTYVRDDGHESGAPVLTWITLGDTQAVRAVLTPTALAGIVGQRIYLTPPDDETAYFVGEVSSSAASFEVSSLPSYGVELRTLLKGPAPAGHLVAHAFGRTYVAQGAFLFVSDPFEFELFDLRAGFLGFDSRITMFIPVADGVYIGTQDRTVFLAGTSPDTFQEIPVFPFGCVEGTARAVRGDLLAKEDETTSVAMWMSKQGVCLGKPGGQAKNLTGGRYVMPASLGQGASLLKIKDGTPQFLVTTF